MLFILLGILGGFVALIGGGEMLVRGASGLAVAARVSPVIIGLTVVAFGTSAPELAVSVTSCYAGTTDLAVGNAVGSNISNLLLILGLSALAMPLTVHARLFRTDIPIMILAAALLWAAAADGELSRLEGIALSLALVGYTIWTVVAGRREGIEIEAEFAEALPQDGFVARFAVQVNLVLCLAGLGLLVLGSDTLVNSCVKLAEQWGVSQLVIGLTIVAIGTSLPELVTSVMASIRGQRDLAVGNVVGSNIFNMLGVLGLSSVVAPRPIEVDAQSLRFDFPVMVAVSIACFPVFLSGFRISRWEGLAMVLYYGAYLAYLIYHAGSAPGGPTPWSTTIWFITPLGIILVLSLADHLRRRKP